MKEEEEINPELKAILDEIDKTIEEVKTNEAKYDEFKSSLPPEIRTHVESGDIDFNEVKNHLHNIIMKNREAILKNKNKNS